MSHDPVYDTVPRRVRRRQRKKRSPLAIVVGIIGELMITAGLFIGLFVVWQVWWTDVEARGAQLEMREQFEKDADDVDFTDVIEDDEKRYDDAPALPDAAPGEVIGYLRAPVWDEYFRGEYNWSVAEHTEPMMTGLDQGHIVRYQNTADPGHEGNFALAGHRQSYGATFHHVDKLELGDALIFETQTHWFVYRVSETDIVLPTDVDVIAPNPDDPGSAATEKLLTLTTCHPLFSTRERFIVHAEFDYWAPKSAGVPREILED